MMRAYCMGMVKVLAVAFLTGCAGIAGQARAQSGDNIPAPISEEVAAIEARPEAVELREMLAAGELDNAAIRAHLREQIESLDKDDPLTGWMTLRLGYIDYRVGDYRASRDNFRRVALGEVAAPVEVRAEAATRFARISSAPPERAMAIRSWREIDQAAGKNTLLRATARHHMATLMLEQGVAVHAAFGGMDNLRIFVDDSLAILPADVAEIATLRAAIAATGTDTWAKESKWAEFLAAHDAWMAEYGDAATGDDWGNLMYSRGLALAGLDRTAEAEAAMLTALGMDGEGARRGPVVLWTRQQALRWLAAQATKDNLADEAATWTALNGLITNAGAIDRLMKRAETHDRPEEARLWKEIQATIKRIEE